MKCGSRYGAGALHGDCGATAVPLWCHCSAIVVPLQCIVVPLQCIVVPRSHWDRITAKPFVTNLITAVVVALSCTYVCSLSPELPCTRAAQVMRGEYMEDMYWDEVT